MTFCCFLLTRMDKNFRCQIGYKSLQKSHFDLLWLGIPRALNGISCEPLIIRASLGYKLNRELQWLSRKTVDRLLWSLQGVSRFGGGGTGDGDSPGFPEGCERQQADGKKSALPSPHGCFNTYTQQG